MIKLDHQWTAPDQQSPDSEDEDAEDRSDYKIYPEDLEDNDNPGMSWL